jgi:lipopolysaccharide transport system ATP-binding protein
MSANGSSPIIDVVSVSKRYRLGTIGATRLIDDAERLWHRMTGRAEKRDRSEFWALRDVSFDVKQGEVVGIVGRNGAGKSTLLKILSRITEPTKGEITLRGRVASLLEVGTGFHPDLTGRENAFLNGAILGMTKAEIRQKLDEIVAFSEIGQFIDTPVKRYSSGMYVRLAFSVAAHLEPEILIVDEVLAVGDAQFQTKCLAKIRSLGDRGQTVLFVSHSLSTVTSLCTKGVVLQQGQVDYIGSAREAVQAYIARGSHDGGRWVRPAGGPPGKGITFQSASLSNGDGVESSDFELDDEIVLRICADVSRPFDNAQFAVRVTNQEGVPIFTTCNTDEARRYLPLNAGLSSYTIRFPTGLLAPGRYVLKIAAHSPKHLLYDAIDDELAFVIHDTGSLEQVLRDDRRGVVTPAVHWESA